MPDSGVRSAAAPLPAASAHAGFAHGGRWDTCPPSAALGVALETAAGPGWRCPDASRDEKLGMLRQCQAMEAWAATAKFGLLRALIREDDQPLPGGGYHGDLPEGWTKSLTHEVALALSMPAVSADRMMWLAWNLEARLPGVGELLAAGTLTAAKAKAVDEALASLSDEDAARAEELILPELPGKTYGQAAKLAAQAAVTVDPDSATRRREDAERNQARVQLLREESGAAALSGRDLPTDQTLAAHASVCARAQEYLDSGAFPGDTRMDQFRAVAYLDLLNGVSAAARIAAGEVVPAGAPGASTPDASAPGAGDPGAPDASGGDPAAPGAEGPGAGGPRGDSEPDLPDTGGADQARLVQPADLVIPLATLLGLGDRPGESHALGPLDPGLCRQLAAAAAASPRTSLCLTVTDADGVAIGHGCARTSRRGHPGLRHRQAAGPLPARLNLTVRVSDLSMLALSAEGPPGDPPWSFRYQDDSGPPDGFGTWTLTGPGGRERTVRLAPIPVFGCDHRHESQGYQPSDSLRHLVQVRDGDCTFPVCSRHARETDFEHAVPYHLGGRTCACNAGSRSRACHRVKQSPGWAVTQPVPGWHHWEGPSGRGYTQGPKRYPA